MKDFWHRGCDGSLWTWPRGVLWKLHRSLESPHAEKYVGTLLTRTGSAWRSKGSVGGCPCGLLKLLVTRGADLVKVFNSPGNIHNVALVRNLPAALGGIGVTHMPSRVFCVKVSYILGVSREGVLKVLLTGFKLIRCLANHKAPTCHGFAGI
jgi:hypothetical protein